jgi:uncharacterized lipoprotein YajG
MTAKTTVKRPKKKAAKKSVNTGNAGKGRKKGVPNKATKQVREALEGALNEGAGAQAYFVGLKNDHPVAFGTVISKLIPIQVEADLKGEIDTNVTITLVGAVANGSD